MQVLLFVLVTRVYDHESSAFSWERIKHTVDDLEAQVSSVVLDPPFLLQIAFWIAFYATTVDALFFMWILHVDCMWIAFDCTLCNNCTDV